MLAARGPKLCVRLYRRHDGTVITQDCPDGVSRMNRRVRRVALAVAGAAFRRLALGLVAAVLFIALLAEQSALSLLCVSVLAVMAVG